MAKDISVLIMPKTWRMGDHTPCATWAKHMWEHIKDHVCVIIFFRTGLSFVAAFPLPVKVDYKVLVFFLLLVFVCCFSFVEILKFYVIRANCFLPNYVTCFVSYFHLGFFVIFSNQPQIWLSNNVLAKFVPKSGRSCMCVLLCWAILLCIE